MVKFIKSFQYALIGIGLALKGRNFKVQLLLFFLYSSVAIYLEFPAIDWIVFLLASGLVFGMEALNSSIEQLCDHVEPLQNEGIRRTKDLAAGAVLIVSLFAFAIGCLLVYRNL